ncbi:MAG: glycosyltransferase family 2 protein [Eubacteriales bacterium]
MNQEKTLTVVIPSYNVEKYLDQTLTSFINNEIMDEIEILIVDDGSKDRTAEIGLKYEKIYPNTFKLISKENGGHGSAINTGIRNATGKYLKNVDGDDWVDTEEFVKLVKALKSCDSDYVYTGYTEYHENDNTMKKNDRLDNLEKMDFDQFITKSKSRYPMHCLTTKTKILQDNNITLDEHCFYVDMEFALYPLPYVRTVTCLDLYVYIYRLGLQTQSVSNEGKKKNRNDHYKVLFKIIEFLVEFDERNLLSVAKKTFLLREIFYLALTQYDIYFLFDVNEDKIKKELVSFNKELKNKNTQIYNDISRIGRIRLFRLLKDVAYEPCIKLIQKKLYE